MLVHLNDVGIFRPLFLQERGSDRAKVTYPIKSESPI